MVPVPDCGLCGDAVVLLATDVFRDCKLLSVDNGVSGRLFDVMLLTPVELFSECMRLTLV